jgi:glycosyltransferase involved in cell wall biosynthesis
MTKQQEIDVSVIIPVFNAAKTLSRTVHSTRNQGARLELILINDCSTDNSLEIAQALKGVYENLIIIDLKHNVGASAARNKGIEVARGKYAAFLDADDVWLPNKLVRQISAFESDPECSLVSCDTLQISPAGEVLRRGHIMKPPVSGSNAWKTLLSYNFIPTPTVLTRTDLVRKAGCFDESLIISEDLDLWISLARMGKVIVIPEVFVHYFDYSNSLMKRGIIDSFAQTQRMIDRHIADDDRLLKNEISNIYAIRYYGIAVDASNAGQSEEASKYFRLAIDNGFPQWKIRLRLVKKKLKEFIKKTLKIA